MTPGLTMVRMSESKGGPLQDAEEGVDRGHHVELGDPGAGAAQGRVAGVVRGDDELGGAVVGRLVARAGDPPPPPPEAGEDAGKDPGTVDHAAAEVGA